MSIKTINFRDATTKRYTKNYTRADGELRAEASDYHERQPYAVMVAVIFLPIDACDVRELTTTRSSIVSRMRLERPPAKPSVVPAWLRSVHGNPAVSRCDLDEICSATSSVRRISSTTGTFGNR